MHLPAKVQENKLKGERLLLQTKKISKTDYFNFNIKYISSDIAIAKK